MGLLGRLGISREGHGSLAGSPTTPAGCYTGAAGVVAEIQGDEGGGRERAVKLREVEDEAVGDYLTAKCTAGRPRWTSGLWSAMMPSVCYRTHIRTKTHANKSTKSVHTKEYIHYATPCIGFFESNHIVHTNIQYTQTRTG